jgi:hypothetical protein
VRRTSDRRRAGTMAAESELAEEPVRMSSEDTFSGVWENDNPRTKGITRLKVRQNTETLAAHAWTICKGQDCDWGSAKGFVSGRSASISWDQGFVVLKMTLFPDGCRLRVRLDSVHTDNEPEATPCRILCQIAVRSAIIARPQALPLESLTRHCIQGGAGVCCKSG